MSTVKATNFSHPSAANPAIVLDAAGGATVAGMGLVLVSPTSIANSGGSASASGGAVTFTGVSSVSLNGVFSGTYSNYKITINAPTNSGNLNFRMRTSGTDNSSSNYYFNGPEVSTSSTNTYTVARSNGLQSYWLTGGFSNGPVGVSLDIFDPQNTEKTRFVGIAISAGDTDLTGRFLTGIMSVTTSYDGLTLYPSSGTITGTIRVYGYRNA